MNSRKYFQVLSKWIPAVLFIVLSILNFIRIDGSSHSASDTLRPFIIQTALLALLLFFISRLITKGLTVKHVK